MITGTEVSLGMKLLKELSALAKRWKDSEINDKIAELQGVLIDLASHCGELEQENRVLQEQAASMDGMERKHEVYWLRAADGSLGNHPYCPSCLQGPRKRVVMSLSTSKQWRCPVCKHVENTPERIAAYRAANQRADEQRAMDHY
jgi:hypothetical protein